MADGAPTVSVIIPTLRRPASLARALESVARQDVACQVVVVDNDPQGSAAPVIERMAAPPNLDLSYVASPVVGVANARNAGVAASRGEFIAFLDDDEEAGPGWLAGLLQVQAETAADIVFGPVRGHPPEGLPHGAYLSTFFSRVGPASSGPIDGYYGCGNSLLRRAALPRPAEPFAAERNHIGGEDDLLFSEMKRAGARFAWAAGAWVLEHPEPARLNLGYALRRAFAYGQGPASDCWAAGPPRWAMIPVWMGYGALQALVFGAAGLAQWALHAPGRAFTLDKAARGLGKLLWFPPFKIGFYGSART